MSQTDNELKGVKPSRRQDVISFNQVMSGDIGEVTSRDQFIDPYALVNPANYRKTRAGQAQYNSDLQQAQLYLQQQQAAYAEWYESPEQQAIRDREAGLNPDLVGLSEGEAGEVSMNPDSPIAGQATNGQVAVQAATGLAAVIASISGAANLASSISTMSVQKAQKDLIKNQADNVMLSNIGAFETLSHKAIAGRLSKAVAQSPEGFDYDSFFADDSNFSDLLSAYAPSDDPRYAAALSRVRTGSYDILKDAYVTGADTGKAKYDFASVLANPYYSDDVKIQSSYMMPIAKAIEELNLIKHQLKVDYAKGINVDSAVDAANKQFEASSAESNYMVDYFTNKDGSGQAKFEQAVLAAQVVVDTMKSSIYQNQFDMYLADPNSAAGMSALYMIMNGTHLSLFDFVMSNLPGITQGVSGVDTSGITDTPSLSESISSATALPFVQAYQLGTKLAVIARWLADMQ